MPKDATDRPHRALVTRAGTAYLRSRTVSACQVCRARRTKCDNERPCAYCRRTGAVCSSEPASATAGFDPASLAILAQLEELSSEVKSLAGHVHRRRDCPSDSATVATPGSRALNLARHLQRGNLAQVLAWDVWQPYQALRHAAAAVIPGAESPRSCTVHIAGRDQGLDFSLFTNYLDDFFRNVHAANAVLNEQDVRAQLTKFLLGGVGWNADSCLLLLVLANGAASSSFGEHSAARPLVRRDEQRWASAMTLFEAAEKRKDMLWHAHHLTQARCHFYSGVFMMVSFRPFDAWRHFLQGLATCQQLKGLRHGHKPHDPAYVEKQAEESIYWSCWKSEREIRSELDMPDFASAGYDHPAMFPAVPEVLNQDGLRSWYFYLAEISLWRFEMAARQSMAELVKHEPEDMDALARHIVDLDVSLASWHASLPDEFPLDATAKVDTSDILPFVLHGRLTYNHEVVTWPFLETLLLFEEHRSALSMELAARGVRVHYDRLSINRLGFYHLHHGTWLMRSSSTRSVFVLLAVARSAFADLLPPDWLQLVSDAVAMLEYWSDAPENAVLDFLKSVLRDFSP
ncbi:hypothetical protein IQ07DRAFT_649457 [Pyrenochaeta sp. DS3sAY3a]|nr:hypothetical protein IQ07DRAFT_649457 [Pyrenochaeta sp. DS3sAY3a]